MRVVGSPPVRLALPWRISGVFSRTESHDRGECTTSEPRRYHDDEPRVAGFDRPSDPYGEGVCYRTIPESGSLLKTPDLAASSAVEAADSGRWRSRALDGRVFGGRRGIPRVRRTRLRGAIAEAETERPSS